MRCIYFFCLTNVKIGENYKKFTKIKIKKNLKNAAYK